MQHKRRRQNPKHLEVEEQQQAQTDKQELCTQIANREPLAIWHRGGQAAMIQHKADLNFVLLVESQQKRTEAFHR